MAGSESELVRPHRKLLTAHLDEVGNLVVSQATLIIQPSQHHCIVCPIVQILQLEFGKVGTSHRCSTETPPVPDS